MKKYFFLFVIFMGVTACWPQKVFVTTIHPFREIVAKIVTPEDKVIEILPPGASPHTYELRPSDLVKADKATAVIIGGKNLDDWAFKFTSKNRFVLLSLIPENRLLYLESRTEIQHFKDDHSHAGVDPHFWTDPLVVQSLLDSLCSLLCATNEKDCITYRHNEKKFSNHLDSLNQALTDYLKPVENKAVMLSHPFFNYFLKRYGIRIAGSVEFSPGTEPTPREIQKMIGMIKKQNVAAILVHFQLPDRAARILAEAAGIKVLVLDPNGGRPGRMTYDELLWYNAEIILKGLM
jgi:zinc transport system substrate-binding protein